MAWSQVEWERPSLDTPMFPKGIDNVSKETLTRWLEMIGYVKVEFIDRKKFNEKAREGKADEKGWFLSKWQDGNYTLSLPNDLKVSETPAIIASVDKEIHGDKVLESSTSEKFRITIIVWIDTLLEKLSKSEGQEFLKKSISKYVALYSQLVDKDNKPNLGDKDWRAEQIRNAKGKDKDKQISDEIEAFKKLEIERLNVTKETNQELTAERTEVELDHLLAEIFTDSLSKTYVDLGFKAVSDTDKGQSARKNSEILDWLAKIEWYKKELKQARNEKNNNIEGLELKATEEVLSVINKYHLHEHDKDKARDEMRYLLLWHILLEDLWIKHQLLSSSDWQTFLVDIRQRKYIFSPNDSGNLYEQIESKPNETGTIDLTFVYGGWTDSYDSKTLRNVVLWDAGNQLKAYIFLEKWKDAGRKEEAIPYLEKALELAPNNIKLVKEIAKVYISYKEYKKGREARESLKGKYWSDEELKQIIAETYFEEWKQQEREGKISEAIISYEMAKKEYPDLDNLAITLWKAYYKARNYQKSYEEIKQIFHSSKLSEEDRIVLLWIYSELLEKSVNWEIPRGTMEAITALPSFKWIKLNQEIIWRYVKTIWKLLDEKNKNEAIALYERLWAENIKDADLLSKIGGIYRTNKSEEKALEAFEASVMLNPRLYDSYKAIKEICIRRWEYDRALQIMNNGEELLARSTSHDVPPSKDSTLQGLKGEILLKKLEMLSWISYKWEKEYKEINEVARQAISMIKQADAKTIREICERLKDRHTADVAFDLNKRYIELYPADPYAYKQRSKFFIYLSENSKLANIYAYVAEALENKADWKEPHQMNIPNASEIDKMIQWEKLKDLSQYLFSLEHDANTK